MNCTDKEIISAFKRDMERNDIRGHHQDQIMLWLDGELTTMGVLENVAIGHMEVVGVMEDGSSPTFRLTDEGFAHAEKLKRRNQ